MRKPGWYWVRYDGEWMVAYYGVLAWTWMYMDMDGFDEMKLHEDMDVPFSEIGPRIPTPDERPLTPCPDGGKCYKKGDTCGDPICVEWHADLLATAPKPESQP